MRMNLSENAQMAIKTLRENKMRSFLTVLGVVIGITALLSVVSILVGVYGNVNDYLSDYGAETLFIFRFDPGIHGRLTPEERTRKPLTLEDAEAIGELCPAVRAVTVSLYPRIVETEGPPRSPVTARYLSKEVAGIDYYGTLPATEEVFNSRPRIGRFFSESENAHRADVAVIGSDIAKKLYPDMDPLGKPIMVGGVTYEVIGVLEPRKGGFVKDQSADRGVMVPYRSYHKHIPQDDEHFVGDQLHRPSGWRRRRNEYHADVRDPAHARNRRTQSARRAPPRCHLAIPHRSNCAYRRRWRHRRIARRRHQLDHPSCSA